MQLPSESRYVQAECHLLIAKAYDAAQEYPQARAQLKLAQEVAVRWYYLVLMSY